MKAGCLLKGTWGRCAVLYLVIAMGSRGWTQTTSASLDAKYIPQDAIAIISVSPKSITSLREFELYPLEVVSAAGMEQVGVDPLNIERVDAVLGIPGPMGPALAVMITMATPVDFEGLKPQFFSNSWTEDNGLRVRPLAGAANMVVHPIDATHAIIGTLPYVRMMAKASNQAGPLASIYAKFKSQQAALAVASIGPVRPLLEGVLEGQSAAIPAELRADVATLVSNVDYIAARVSVGAGSKTQLLIAGLDTASAEKIEVSFNRLLTQGVALAQQGARRGIAGNSPTQRAAQAYSDRIGKAILNMLKPQRTNERMLIELENNTTVATTGVLVGLLLPAVQSAREAARRMQSSNNLKQIVLAMHNYNDTHRKLPEPAIRGADGKPLLSWRVAILPFIEQQELYKQFHLDEPWDSPHNIKLVERMPPTFRHPSSIAPAGRTTYLAVVGDEIGFKKEGDMKINDITDGTSNTIAYVTVADAHARIWTAPEDLEPTQANPLDKLRGGVSNGGFDAALFDGSVRFIATSINPNVLWSLFTRAGGETSRIPR